MLTELVFSFLLNSWTGVERVYTHAGSGVQGFQVLNRNLKDSRLLFCTLESKGLLSFDGRWRGGKSISIPKKCTSNHTNINKYELLRVRSASVRLTDIMHSWDQKIDIQVPGKATFSFYLRQDKKYVGIHSSQGWSAWVERKTGVFRFELADFDNKSHFRMWGKGVVNPVMGRFERVSLWDALYVQMRGSRPLRAVMLSGHLENYHSVEFGVTKGSWQKTKIQCEGSCHDLVRGDLEESVAATFGKIESSSYQNFVREPHPLAFPEIEPKDLVPITGTYR